MCVSTHSRIGRLACQVVSLGVWRFAWVCWAFVVKKSVHKAHVPALRADSTSPKQAGSRGGLL